MDESLVAKYPDLERSHFWWGTRRRLMGQLISDLPIASPTILDVGCGSGVTSRMLADAGSSVVGVDVEPGVPSTSGGAFRYVCGDYSDLAADLGEFDVVLALDAVEHFEDESGVLRSLLMNTRPGGVAIVTVPAYDWLWSSHDEENRHFRRYTRKRLTKALSGAGFDLERVGYLFGGLLPPKALVTAIEKGRSRNVTIANVPLGAMNRAAGAYFRCETGLASRLHNFLPFGTSVVALARRPNSVSQSASG